MPGLRLLFLLCALCPMPGQAETVWVGRFTEPSETNVLPVPWRIEQLDENTSPTRFRIVPWEGAIAMEARANKSMALLTRPITVDLGKTPVLCWRWRIDAVVETADMTKKSGDDYAARVYLAFSVPPEQVGLGLRAKLGLARAMFGANVPDAALNYVWDNRQAIDTLQANTYTDRARMLVLRSGNGQVQRWIEERRNVLQDFQRAFGHLPANITALALTSDTDNTASEARAGFADFRFVADEAACPKSPYEKSSP